MRCCVDGMLGYLSVGDENVAATTGATTSIPDLVESLNFGGYQEAHKPWRSDTDSVDCPWLDADFAGQLPCELREAAKEYWRCSTKLMLALMELSELALDLPPGHFSASYAEPGTL